MFVQVATPDFILRAGPLFLLIGIWGERLLSEVGVIVVSTVIVQEMCRYDWPEFIFWSGL